ncbi:S8 family serine peptidase [Waterburya agarophytonicola K14]|uniref:S8 family serine peptidase n=1 Tax=Waterburya agarophytonicola KI4 TaxID=2874699 RepID=A0A964FHD3_9CYAN|nr:S8 family serine peptidase [Waterburya agarophytonicola]MCC0179875.1 S8 family serine peptidase [Waterburya agarophytonicola KI4]
MDNVLPNDPLFSQQWYLNNTGQSGGTPGEDINVLPAWEIATGDGVVIGFVDGAIELGHPDLDSQNNPLGGFDFVDDEIERFIPGLNAAIAVGFEFDLGSILDGTNLDSLNFLDRPSDAHGTPVAGIAVASNNNIGITGVAYDATFASYRIQFDDEIILDDFDELISSTFSRPSSVDIFNNSWLFPLPLVPLGESNQALEQRINFGRGGLGNIFVFAAGNNAQQGGNVNYYPLTNSRYTITVGALDHNGVRSSYSNPGASLLISSYANTDEEGILTTDVRGESGFDTSEYTEFTGTSAATPIVSGVIALMLEANPDLTWRDVQHILVRTAVQNDIDNPDWIENGAGYSVNHNYGFGSIDATAAVTLSQEWTTVAPEISLSSPVIDIDVNVPDNARDGITSIIDVEDDLTVESIEVITNADLVREDLKVVLTSPDGTESILSANDLNADREGTWTFTSLRHWGESSAGEWSLQVIDSEASTSETTWDSWQLNLYGTNDNLNSESTEEDNTDNNNSEFQSSDVQSLIDSLIQRFPNTGENNLNSDDIPNTPGGNGADTSANSNFARQSFVTDGETILAGDNFFVIPNFENNPFFADTISSEATIIEIETETGSSSIEEQLRSINFAENEVPLIDGDLYVIPILTGIDTRVSSSYFV